MEIEKSTLRKFLDISWLSVRSRIDHNPLFKATEDLLIPPPFLESNIPLQIATLCGMIAIGTSLHYNASTTYRTVDEKLESQVVFTKPNGEKIPIYVASGSLDESIQRIHQILHFLAESSTIKGWKFAVAVNEERWMIFGVDSSVNEWLVLCETYEMNPKMDTKSLKPFFNDLLTIIFFDVPHDLVRKYGNPEEETFDEKSDSDPGYNY